MWWDVTNVTFSLNDENMLSVFENEIRYWPSLRCFTFMIHHITLLPPFPGYIYFTLKNTGHLRNSIHEVRRNFERFIFLNHRYQITFFFMCCVYLTAGVLGPLCARVQYIPRNMHTVFALLCFVVVIHWLIFPYPPGLLRWHCVNLTIAPVPAKQPWWIWINT